MFAFVACGKHARHPPTFLEMRVPKSAHKTTAGSLPKLDVHEPNRARLPRVEETEDTLAHAVRAREHRENCRRDVEVGAVRGEGDARV